MVDRAAKSNFTHVSSDGIFQGYAVVWSSAFHDGVTVKPGAFAACLEEYGAAGIKMLWQHDDSQPIGAWLEIREDKIGLFVRGQLNMELERAQEIHSNMMKSIVDGLSVSYLDGTMEMLGGVLQKAELVEISVVTFPSMEVAQVDTVQFSDRLTLDGVRRTPDGYLTAVARVARAGVQLYKGREVGRPDLDVVRIYRPESEVFKQDTMRSFAHRPVTNDHPPVAVSSENWKKYAVGQTGDEVVRDGKFVRVPLVLMDADVIRDYENGKSELSQGYSTDVKWGAGTSPDGEVYDAMQVNIRNNHLAVVDAARGGADLRIGDDIRGDRMSTMKAVTIDGVSVEMTDVAAQVVQRSISGLESQITRLKEKLSEEEDKEKKAKAKDAESVTALAAKDAEIVTLKKQVADAAVTPAKLDEMVKDRMAVVTRAESIIGDKLVVDGKSIEDIRKQVVDSVVGDAAKGWNSDQIAASFNTIQVPDGASGGSGGRPPLAHDLSRSRVVDGREDAYAAYEKKLQDGWKSPAARTQ